MEEPYGNIVKRTKKPGGKNGRENVPVETRNGVIRGGVRTLKIEQQTEVRKYTYVTIMKVMHHDTGLVEFF